MKQTSIRLIAIPAALRVVWLLGSGIVLLGGCGSAPEPELPSKPVKMLTLSSGSHGNERKYPGTVRAFEIGYMSFEVAGRLVEFPVREGERVKKGDLIARVDGRDYLAKVNAAKARVDQARAEYDRNRALYERRAMSLASMQVAQRNFEVAEAEYRVVEKAYQDTFLRAPFDGVVARKLVENFQQVQAKQDVAIVEDSKKLKVIIHVPERDFISDRLERTPTDIDEINRLVDMRAEFTSLPGKSFPVNLLEFSTRADASTQTFEVTLVLEPPADAGLLPGMTASVVVNSERLGMSRVKTFEVPSRAVFSDSTGKAYVWKVVADGDRQVVRKAEVQPGPLSGRNMMIESGVASGDTIVVSGVQALRDGQAVTRLDENGQQPQPLAVSGH